MSVFEGLCFHHVGVACKDLDREEETFSLLGYSREGEDFFDPIQCVSCRFLAGQHPRLELLVAGKGSGVLSSWLNAGVKLYHLAYETRDLDGTIAKLRERNAKLVVAPVPGTCYDGRRIAFLVLSNRLMVELIEK